MAIDPITDNLLGVAINIEAKKEKREQTLEECLDEYADNRYMVSFSTHLKKMKKYNFRSKSVRLNLCIERECSLAQKYNYLAGCIVVRQRNFYINSFCLKKGITETFL